MQQKPTISSYISGYPLLGTLIDEDTLELVEILKAGRYDVVYRAIDILSDSHASYTVQCRKNNDAQSSLRRRLHHREITLHKIASGHPSVVTLYRVLEDPNYTFMIMKYAPNHDLLFQITQNRRYLGKHALIQQVFLQLLDAVEYCHGVGIYHRYLHPSNIMCFKQGRRVAIKNFRGATINKLSTGYRKGSSHNSPECQAGDSDYPIPYSPAHSDIWSLGIILLNIVTGRNPWSAANLNDRAYQVYLRDPVGFFPRLFPVSKQFHDILVRTLKTDYQERLSLSQLRVAIQNIDTFYSDKVVFHEGVALCPWQVDIDQDRPLTVLAAFDSNAAYYRPQTSHANYHRIPKRHSIYEDFPNRRHAGFW